MPGLYDVRFTVGARHASPALVLMRSWTGVSIALDATYSLGRNLSGVGVYSRRLLTGLAQAHPDERFLWYYRPHRFLRSMVKFVI